MSMVANAALGVFLWWVFWASAAQALMVGYVPRLRQAIQTACPLVTNLSVTVVGNGPANTVTFDPPSQQSCVDTAVAAFDWSQAAQDAWELGNLRGDATSDFADTGNPDATLKRAIAGVLLDEINVIRASYPIPIASITRSGTTATATTRWPHGLSNGQVTIHGADVAAYDGIVTITVTGASTFTYTVAGSPTTPAAGSLWVLPITAAPAQRTMSQVKTAIQSKISSGGADQ